jgi:hypothetical protein
MIGFDAVGREPQRLGKIRDSLIVRAPGQRRDTALKSRFSRVRLRLWLRHLGGTAS